MNKKMKNNLKNISYAISSNMISLLISSLVVLVIPRFLDVEKYGYFQLYLFYSGFVGFLHLGWNDGMYLRYGGEEYSRLDKSLFASQFYMLAIFQTILFLIFSLIIFSSAVSGNRAFILLMTTTDMIIVNVRFFLYYLLQATNRITDYARSKILDRVLYAFLIITIIFFRNISYQTMIFSDLLAKLISLVFVIYICKDIVFYGFNIKYFDFSETFESIKVGINLMLANFTGKLIIGFIRLGIERNWSIITFGKVSLTLSISSLMMIFVRALGVILFPLLRRSSSEKLPIVYNVLKDVLMVTLLGMLLLYYPINEVLRLWLPSYAEGLTYMGILFPLVVFESKKVLLISTYYKTLRKEKTLLAVNLISLIMSIMITVLTTYILHNLNLAIFSIVLLVGFRTILSEVLLAKFIEINVIKDIFLEIILIGVFIITAWFFNNVIFIISYSISYVIYLFIKKKSIKGTLNYIKLQLVNK